MKTNSRCIPCTSPQPPSASAPPPLPGQAVTEGQKFLSILRPCVSVSLLPPQDLLNASQPDPLGGGHTQLLAASKRANLPSFVH